MGSSRARRDRWPRKIERVKAVGRPNGLTQAFLFSLRYSACTRSFRETNAGVEEAADELITACPDDETVALGAKIFSEHGPSRSTSSVMAQTLPWWPPRTKLEISQPFWPAVGLVRGRPGHPRWSADPRRRWRAIKGMPGRRGGRTFINSGLPASEKPSFPPRTGVPPAACPLTHRQCDDRSASTPRSVFRRDPIGNEYRPQTMHRKHESHR